MHPYFLRNAINKYKGQGKPKLFKYLHRNKIDKNICFRKALFAHKCNPFFFLFSAEGKVLTYGYSYCSKG